MMSKNQWAIGIDLGGSKIEVALVDSSGLLHDRLHVPTQSKQGYQAICRLILGGGIMEGMPQSIERIEKGVKKYALKAATENLKVLPAKFQMILV